LSDEACEDALYDVAVLREFCRIDLGRERVPDATTLLNFRHLLEAHELGAALFAKVGQLRLEGGMTLSSGTIVHATLIAAPPSIENPTAKRPFLKQIDDWEIERQALATQYAEMKDELEHAKALANIK